jgi:DNA integrity scanning protein DisA with diadenylate cyclase activity
MDNKDSNNDFVPQQQMERYLTSEDYIKFSELFNHKNTQKLISDSIKEHIKNLITNDNAIKQKLKEIVKDVEKERCLIFKRIFCLIYEV